MGLYVGIDATSLLVAHPRGEGKTLLRLYREIARLAPDWRFRFYGQHSGSMATTIQEQVPRSTVAVLRAPGYRFDTWDNVALPLAAWRDGVDVLHCSSSGTPVLCPVPVVMTVHDLIPMLHDDGADSRYRRRFARHLRAGVRVARRIICVSENTRRDLVTTHPDATTKAVVIPWGIDPPTDVVCELPAAISKTPFVVGLGGGGAKRKNVPTMIRALAALPQHLADVVLVVLGVTNAAEREALSALAKELAVDRRVRLEAFVTEAMLDAYLKNAACVLYLSTYEGFGLPPLEAMRHGTPVLASNRSSVPEVVGDAALQVDPDDVAGTAAALATILSDNGLRLELGRCGIARAETFSWETTAQKTIEVLARTATRAN